MAKRMPRIRLPKSPPHLNLPPKSSAKPQGPARVKSKPNPAPFVYRIITRKHDRRIEPGKFGVARWVVPGGGKPHFHPDEATLIETLSSETEAEKYIRRQMYRDLKPKEFPDWENDDGQEESDA